MPVQTVFDNLEAGMSVSEITEVFDVTLEEVKAAIHFARQSLVLSYEESREGSLRTMTDHHYTTVTWTGNLGPGTVDYLAYSRNFELEAEGRHNIAGS